MSVAICLADTGEFADGVQLRAFFRVMGFPIAEMVDGEIAHAIDSRCRRADSQRRSRDASRAADRP